MSTPSTAHGMDRTLTSGHLTCLTCGSGFGAMVPPITIAIPETRPLYSETRLPLCLRCEAMAEAQMDQREAPFS